METQNVTLSIRKEVLRKAKLVAVKRGTSLSKLMSEALEAIASTEEILLWVITGNTALTMMRPRVILSDAQVDLVAIRCDHLPR